MVLASARCALFSKPCSRLSCISTLMANNLRVVLGTHVLVSGLASETFPMVVDECNRLMPRGRDIALDELPKGFKSRYIVLSARIVTEGANLGMPHTRAMGDGLFELRLKSVEGIARVMYCTMLSQRVMMLHSFIKKTEKTPNADLELAIKRMKEVKHGKNQPQ